MSVAILLLGEVFLLAQVSTQPAAAPAQPRVGQPILLADGTRLVVSTGSPWADKYAADASLKQATGQVLAISFELAASSNPQLSLILDSEGSRSWLALEVGDKKLGPFRVVAPEPNAPGGFRISRLSQQFLPGYVYATDDGRRGCSTFVSSTPFTFSLLFDVPTELMAGPKKLHVQLKVDGKSNEMQIPLSK